MKHYLDWTIERDEESFDIEIEGTYTFGSPASGPTLFSAGEPPEPDEFEFEKVTYFGAPFDLTDDEYDKILDWIYSNPPEPDYDEY